MKKALVAFALLFAFILGLGLGAGGKAKPKTVTHNVTHTVTSIETQTQAVAVTPTACADAINQADLGFRAASDYAGIAARVAGSAAAGFGAITVNDTAAMDKVTAEFNQERTEIDAVGARLTSIVPLYHAAAQGCIGNGTNLP
jgi:hypothetical protein